MSSEVEQGITSLESQPEKSSLRKRADHAKEKRCNTLICVLENPKILENIGTVIRNVDTLGVGKLYVIDGYKLLPDDWEKMRKNRTLNTYSVSAAKWVYIHRFSTTAECIAYLKRKNFVSIATSPHNKLIPNVSLCNAKFTQSKLAIWFGTEATGITDEAVAACQSCVQVEMSGIIESINLAVCTGIVLYQAVQQRWDYIRSRRSVQK